MDRPKILLLAEMAKKKTHSGYYKKCFIKQETAAHEDEEEGTSGQSACKRLKVEPEKKKEKRQKVDEDEIQKMQ